MTEDEIEAILRAAGAEYRHTGRGVNAWCMDGDLMPLIEALLAANAPVVPAEPIGEVKRSHFGGRARNIGFDSVVLYEGAKVSPGDKVYAAPVAPAPYFNRRAVERAIEAMKAPQTGMQLNDNKERPTLPVGTLERMLKIIDMLGGA